MASTIEKLSQVINTHKHLPDLFYKKWGIKGQDIIEKLSDNGLHGGIYSKAKSIKNITKVFKNRGNVLNIGPETGIEIFLLLELGFKVDICEPDSENLKLLTLISKEYILNDGDIAYNNLNFKNIGFSVDRIKTTSERRNYISVHKILKTGLPTFYKLSKNSKDFSTLDKKYDVVFVHKILTTLTRFQKHSSSKIFVKSVKEIISKVNKNGLISWTEPTNLFDNSYNFSNLGNQVERLTYNIPDIGEKYVQFLIHK